MTTPQNIASSWTTSSYGEAAHTSPGELSELGEHMDSCHGARGRLFKLQRAVETVNRFMAPRFVTTLVVAVLLIGAGSLFS